MSTKSQPARSNSQESRALSRLDRGSINLIPHPWKLDSSTKISLPLLLFATLEILSSYLTDHDKENTKNLYQLQLRFLQISNILSPTMVESALTSQNSQLFRHCVRVLEGNIKSALGIVRKSKNSSDNAAIIRLLDQKFESLVLSHKTPPSINIDIPQADIQLRSLVPMNLDGTVMINVFENLVIYRYVQDFNEVKKLGKGAFGSVFLAKNRLDDRNYAIKKIIFNGNNKNLCRRQAQCALREVRVLASLSHPNVVQYHCAWLELVPVIHRVRQQPSMSTEKPIFHVKQTDSLDDMIQFRSQSKSSDHEEKDDSISISSADHRSKAESKAENDDDSDTSSSCPDVNSKNNERSHSDGDNESSFSRSNIDRQYSASSLELQSIGKSENRQLVPLQYRNQNIHGKKSNLIDGKIVLFIQMQLCDGTLHDWLRYRDQRIISENNRETLHERNIFDKTQQHQCWQIFRQILVAAEYLHAQGFVHRDIKPRNIFLAHDAKDASFLHVKLGDFGLATLSDTMMMNDTSDELINNESAGVGTALYAPPEQLHARRSTVTELSDSYSLGIVLYELFHVFATEMERLSCLTELRAQTRVEPSFSEIYPFESDLIEKLVSIEVLNRPSAANILRKYAEKIKEKSRNPAFKTKREIIQEFQQILRDKDERIRQLQLALEQKQSD